MTREVGDPPWMIKGDMLVDAHGTHLLRLVEQPGLRGHGDEILEQIAAAPELLDSVLTALPYVEDALDDPVFRKGVVRRHVREMRALIARIDGRDSPG